MRLASCATKVIPLKARCSFCVGLEMSNNVNPVAGAARYTQGIDNGNFVVIMTDIEGFRSVIEKHNTFVNAIRAADKWQAKENKAVLKATKLRDKK